MLLERNLSLLCPFLEIKCTFGSVETTWLWLQGTKDFLKGMGLGMIADQLAELKLGELLDTPPPGLDEAVAIGKVITHRLVACHSSVGNIIGKDQDAFELQ